MIATSDGTALLAAIVANPDEDTPRLAYADWLDGLPTVSVPCPNGECRNGRVCVSSDIYEGNEWDDCSTCSGTGFVPDTSNSDRAALIRVQCELTALTVGVQGGNERWQLTVAGLITRERELLTANSDRWRRGPQCAECGGTGSKMHAEGSSHPFACPACFGTGDCGGLMRHYPTGPHAKPEDMGFVNEVTYHRGFPRIHCRGEDVWELRSSELDLGGYGGPTGPGGLRQEWVPTKWAEAVCRHHDVTELWVTDREPFPDHALTLGKNVSDTFDWYSCSHGAQFEAAVVPEPVFDIMKRPRPSNTTPLPGLIGEALEHPTAEAARVALARAVVRWVRSHTEPGDV